MKNYITDMQLISLQQSDQIGRNLAVHYLRDNILPQVKDPQEHTILQLLVNICLEYSDLYDIDTYDTEIKISGFYHPYPTINDRYNVSYADILAFLEIDYDKYIDETF